MNRDEQYNETFAVHAVLDPSVITTVDAAVRRMSAESWFPKKQSERLDWIRINEYGTKKLADNATYASVIESLMQWATAAVLTGGESVHRCELHRKLKQLVVLHRSACLTLPEAFDKSSHSRGLA
jgi:predicted protein tyrosine phosphatase